jgi:hypothetical protein
MTLNICAKITSCSQDLNAIQSVLDALVMQGYTPLIRTAKSQFNKVFQDASLPVPPISDDPEFYMNYAYRTRVGPRSRLDSRLPIAGDFFASKNDGSTFYMILAVSDSSAVIRQGVEQEPETSLEIGHIGNVVNTEEFDDIVKIISDTLASRNINLDWHNVERSSEQLVSLASNDDNRFLPATNMSDDELSFAEVFSDDRTRNLAITVKRSGGILANDLIKKSGAKSEEVEAFFERMTRDGLLNREYVIICHKSSNQINKVDSMEKIAKMAELGVLCSCGRPIQDERVQELYSPSVSLQKMIDQSYWMTARLVRALKTFHIPEHKIFLNVQDGAEEVDAFVDIDGSLLMFELKDNEFSMGHAYPFGGRIGLYRPDYAVIFATKGIAPEVRDYFNKSRPGAKLIYVGNVSELETNIEKIISQIRSARIENILSLLEPISTNYFPLSSVLMNHLGIEARPARRASVRRSSSS